MGPAWQAITPELVPRPTLRPAIALNSLGVNVARAIGPALGFIVATAGMALAYWLDAASYILITLALLRWRRSENVPALPPERFGPAMATGLRYVLGSPGMQRALLRSAAFFLFASAYWALLIAAAGAAGVGLLTSLVRLPAGDLDLTPATPWPEPAVGEPIGGERGPLAVEIRYRVSPPDRAAFLQALQVLAGERRRDGAYGWGVYEDAADPAAGAPWPIPMKPVDLKSDRVANPGF
ncbi:MFS transporter [Phenylobacterium sp.]|uniref:MFS transporter n=1 Tax=Phenylobacterium sp. TaxID=1871053 RepID=UPI0026134BB3|nr:MFS transporter [Phenylobacterium sp.]